MSDNWKELPRQETGNASESRVVPAIGATIARREPIILLKRVDFPTLGRPMRTTDRSFRGIECVSLAIT